MKRHRYTIAEMKFTMLFSLGFLVLLGIIGNCDRRDEAWEEMRSGAAYTILKTEHPLYTDEQLVDTYIEERERAAQDSPEL